MAQHRPPRIPNLVDLTFEAPPAFNVDAPADNLEPIIISDDDEQRPNPFQMASPSQLRPGRSEEPTVVRCSADESVRLIRVVLPDICRDYAKRLVRERDILTVAACETLIATLLDEDYPKNNKRAKRKRDDLDDDDTENEMKAKFRKFSMRPRYKDEAVSILRLIFPRFSVAYITEALSREGTVYATYCSLCNQQRDNRPSKIPVATAVNQQHINAMVNKTDDIREELLAAKRRTERDAKREAERIRHARASARAEEKNLEEAQRKGEMGECCCCFGDFPLNRMVHCNGEAVHLFCPSCVKRYVETEIGLLRCRPVCFGYSDKPCEGAFTRSQLLLCLDPRTLEKLENLQQQEDVEAAGLDLAECPFCDFKADYGPIEENKEFRCHNPECGKTSCRLCNKLTHVPMNCDEAREKETTSARHEVEEAKSDALIRRCNRCKRPFIKENGCNKMTCVKCHNTQCYLCGEDIKGYNHFDKGSCRVHDDEDLNTRHRKEVIEAETKAVARVREAHPELSDAELGIDQTARAQEESALRTREEERRRLRDAMAHHVPAIPGPWMFAPVPPLVDQRNRRVIGQGEPVIPDLQAREPVQRPITLDPLYLHFEELFALRPRPRGFEPIVYNGPTVQPVQQPVGQAPRQQTQQPHRQQTQQPHRQQIQQPHRQQIQPPPREQIQPPPRQQTQQPPRQQTQQPPPHPMGQAYQNLLRQRLQQRMGQMPQQGIVQVPQNPAGQEPRQRIGHMGQVPQNPAGQVPQQRIGHMGQVPQNPAGQVPQQRVGQMPPLPYQPFHPDLFLHPDYEPFLRRY